ncbi:PepSY domain-containing protein [Pseudomonas sp. BW7P1]|uniref:PepSY domain-containing protein n=1 Tax=Pseudomonas TaxID=286 RepID=UPI0021AD9EB6|nr:PepSY domain-containing protein [Pseudomonas sp. BW7P1]UWI60068.1 PepSY domain-containing protein [Pseudomonas sp. BW7P1]
MKTLTALSLASLIGLSASLVQARDLVPDEAQRLLDAGTIVPFEQLIATALARHPGATITDAELKEKYGKYLYQVDLRDPQGLEWDVELDAVSGQVLKDHQDT